jgi:hypothetical protein
MTKMEIVKDIRATLDRDRPGWRNVLRRQMDAEQPGWVAALAKIRVDGDRLVEVALLANPERVPDSSEIDPQSDPFQD